MAKLPYTYTICPDQEAPAQFTASCADMGELLRHSPNGDLTINQSKQPHGICGQAITWGTLRKHYKKFVQKTRRSYELPRICTTCTAQHA